MTRTERAAVIITDAALIFCGAVASVCAAPTAYGVTFDLRELIPPVLGISILISLWFGIKRRGFVVGIILLVVSAAAVLVKFRSIANGARLVFSTVISSLFSVDSYRLSEEEIKLIADTSSAATWFLTAAAVLLAFLIALALIKGRKLIPSLLIPVPFFLASMVYTNQRPAVWCAVMIMIYVGGVLTGFGLRKAKTPSAGVFMAILLPLLLILSFAILKLFPESSYRPIPYEQRRELFGNRIGSIRDTLFLSSQNPDETELDSVGDRLETDDRLFSVRSSKAGTYLLRSHSYGRYSNNAWLAADEYKGEWRSQEALGSGRTGGKETLSVYGSKANERYVPYCFEPDPRVKTNESYVRAMGETEYDWSFCSSYALYTREVSEAEQEYYSFAVEQYTMPACAEKDALLLILKDAGISRSGSDYETALRVAEFVRGSGVYSLTPKKAPEGADFVQYFLAKGHEGYCVHFATATAALLQALDVPARYTAGCYVGITNPDEWMEVPQRQTHAWVEVYIPGVGWIPIESTPGFTIGVSVGGGEDPVDPYAPYSPLTPTEIPPVEINTKEPGPTPTPAPGKKTPDPLTTPGPSYSPKPSEASSDKPVRSERPTWYRWLFIPAGYLILLLIGTILRNRREARFMQEDGRKGVLLMLKYHGMLRNMFGVPALAREEELANEASFSRHDMKAEQKELYERICTVRRRLCMESVFRKLLFRWILFVL